MLAGECNDRCVVMERGKAYLSNEQYELALIDFERVATMD